MVLAKIIIFQTFPNMVWEGIVLGTILEKSEAKRKTLSGIRESVMVLARLTILPNFPNMVWEGIVLGTILEKMTPLVRPVNFTKIPDKLLLWVRFFQNAPQDNPLPNHVGKSW